MSITVNGNLYKTLPTNPINAFDNSKPWTDAVPVISTVHLLPALGDTLDKVTTGLVIAAMPGDGYIIKIPDGEEMADPDAPPTTYPEINSVLTYLADRGYCYARFSPMGDVYQDLPQFDW